MSGLTLRGLCEPRQLESSFGMRTLPTSCTGAMPLHRDPEALLLTAAALRKLSDSYRALFLSGYGGNAFLMTVSCREESAEVLVQRFTDLLERDPAVSGLPFRVTVNIGCAIAAEGGMTVEELAGEAGHALCGKREGAV